MLVIDWTDEFDRWFTRWESAAAQGGDPDAQRRYDLLLAELAELQALDGEPMQETATFRRVVTSKRYPLWRVSHPHVDGIAVRVICWFPPDGGTVVVAIVGADKTSMGNAFYDRLADRADPIIDTWLRHREGEP